MKYVKEGDLAILLSQAYPQGVNKFEYTRIQKYVANVNMLQSFRASVILADGLCV